MVQRKNFGRRLDQSSRALARPRADIAVEKPRDSEPALPAADPSFPELSSLDDELRDWQSTRRKTFKLPWRQIALMSSLCFGVASFVLPEALNDALQWPLGALIAVSAYLGWRKRKDAPAPE